MEAFVRRAADGTFEADLFELDGIPPKDPPRVRGKPSAYVATRELVLAFSKSSVHADLWLVPIPPALTALMEQLRRPAPPPPPSLHGAGSASHCPITLDNEDEPGGTAPLAGAVHETLAAPAAGAAAPPKVAAEDDEAAELVLGHASSSAARDPAVQPARRPGTRPPLRLDHLAWDAYVYPTRCSSNTFYGAWGFDGKPARHDELFNDEAKKGRAIPLANRRPTKEDAAMRRYEGLLRYGEGARISYALREFYHKQTVFLDLEMRQMLGSVRAIYETGACRLTVLRRLEQEPPHRLAQLVLLAAAPEQHPELHSFASRRPPEPPSPQAPEPVVAPELHSFASLGATTGGTLPHEIDSIEVAEPEGGGERRKANTVPDAEASGMQAPAADWPRTVQAAAKRPKLTAISTSTATATPDSSYTATYGSTPDYGAVVGDLASVALGMAEVREMLERFRLGTYAANFDEAGYDDRDFILQMNAEHLDALVRDVGMKPGHALKFRDFLAQERRRAPQVMPQSR